MEGHALRVLEFEKIVQMLAQHAACSLGHERALTLAPHTNLKAIQLMQQETTEAKDVLDEFGNIPLGGIVDIRNMVHKATVQAIVLPLELVDIAQTLAAARSLKSFILKHRDDHPLLGQMAQQIVPMEPLERQILQCIGKSGEVLDSASLTLARVRSDLKVTHSRIIDRLNAILQSSKYKTAIQEFVITQREDRYCIPVKVEYRAQLRGIVHDASASGATVFVEPEQVVGLGNDMKQLAAREREEVDKVLRQLGEAVAKVAPEILATVEILGHIDFVTAKAKLSIAQDAVEPALNKNGWVSLIQARHPLLSGYVVPIDVELGRKFKALLITGPNTGGKTVTLKTIGLLSLMAQAGLHIPADDGTEVAVFDDIFADIGDEQSIEQSLSTFSSHIRNIVRVLKAVGPKSLVLFDEIGAGTDPAEGAALARSILEFIMHRDARIVATTHYGELKEFAFAHEGVQNASVEFDLETLRPTYRLMIGVPGSSNAFAIASRLGMPQGIIETAEKSIVGREDGSDEIIRRIEESHREAMESRRIAKAASNEAEILQRRYEEQLRKLEAARAKVEDEVRAHGKKVVERYTQRLEQVISDISQAQNDAKKVERLKQQARALVREVQSDLIEPSEIEDIVETPAGHVFKKGDPVRIANLNQEGMLMSDIQDGQAVVAIGAMKINVQVSSIRPILSKMKSKKAAEAIGTDITLQKAASVSTEVNLIGQRAEQALYNLEKYIDEVLTAGQGEVRIIHGKGTGALRKAVWEYLKTHPAVASFRLGELNEGGAGATVVTFK